MIPVNRKNPVIFPFSAGKMKEDAYWKSFPFSAGPGSLPAAFGQNADTACYASSCIRSLVTKKQTVKQPSAFCIRVYVFLMLQHEFFRSGVQAQI